MIWLPWLALWEVMHQWHRQNEKKHRSQNIRNPPLPENHPQLK